MITTGIILLIVGVLTGIPILTTLGVVLALIGGVLLVLGTLGRAVGGRAHYW